MGHILRNRFECSLAGQHMFWADTRSRLAEPAW